MREVTGSSPVVPTRFYKKSECEFRTFSFYLTAVFILQTFLAKGGGGVNPSRTLKLRLKRIKAEESHNM